jgi:hypothetical protein
MSCDQEDKAAAAIKKATRANAEDHGTRPLEQVRELREQAAKSGHICGDCFQPIEPGASVTIETRSVHVPAEDFGKLGKRPAHDHKLLVPICIACWLLRIQRVGAITPARILRQAHPASPLRRLRATDATVPARVLVAADPEQQTCLLRRLPPQHAQQVLTRAASRRAVRAQVRRVS